jgi:rod shape determining protein RodA
MFNLKRINILLALLPVLIFSLGYVVHLSTSSERASTQMGFFIISYLIFWAVSFTDYRILDALHIRLYWFVLITLALVFVLGEAVLGSVRWISLGFFNFQPSEFAKFGLVVFIAFYLNKRPNIFSKPKEFLKFMAYVLPVIILVVIQPDLGSSIILMILLTGMLFASGLSWLYFAIAVGVFGLLSTPLWHLLHEYQQHRILVFLNPSLDTLGRGYNVIQSLISIGSGGFWGKGFGHGTQSHLNFLPIYWTDFIFAAFAEEWGFLGVFVLLALFTALFLTILYCVSQSSDRVGSVLATGSFVVLFGQFFINIGMNMGLLPVTGIPLPLVSLGGTSMITTALLLGLVHSVWLYRKQL